MNTKFSLPTITKCWCRWGNTLSQPRGSFSITPFCHTWLILTTGLWSPQTWVSCGNCTKKNQVSKAYSVNCLSEFILIEANKGAVYTRSSSHCKNKISQVWWTVISHRGAMLNELGKSGPSTFPTSTAGFGPEQLLAITSPPVSCKKTCALRAWVRGLKLPIRQSGGIIFFMQWLYLSHWWTENLYLPMSFLCHKSVFCYHQKCSES